MEIDFVWSSATLALQYMYTKQCHLQL